MNKPYEALFNYKQSEEKVNEWAEPGVEEFDVDPDDPDAHTFRNVRLKREELIEELRTAQELMSDSQKQCEAQKIPPSECQNLSELKAELHIEELSQNTALIQELSLRLDRGLPRAAGEESPDSANCHELLGYYQRAKFILGAGIDV